MTPFPQDDEQKKWKALLGMDTLSAPALSDPAMQPQAMPPQPQQPSLMPDTAQWQALANQLPDPPTASYNPVMDKGGLVLAMFADALLNKGRSMGPLMAAAARPGPDVDEENYKRQRQHALDQAQVQHMLQQQQVDPRVLAARERGLDIQNRGLDLEQARLDAMNAKGAAGLTPDQQLARERFEFEKSHYGEPTAYQQDTIDLRRQQAADAAAARADAADIRRQQIEAAAATRANAEDQRADRETAKQSRDFAKDTLRMRQAAHGAAGVDDVMKRYPDGSDIPGIGPVDSRMPDMLLSDDGMALKQHQRWMAEAILRGDTGAAAPLTEHERNAIKVGSNAGATEKQFRIAHDIMREYLKKNIRAFETNREGPARDVLANEGLDEWVNGKPKPPAPPPPASRETQTPTGGTGIGGRERVPVTGGTSTRIGDTPGFSTQPPAKKGIAQKLPNGKLQLPSGAMVDDTPQARARYDVQ